MRLWVSFFLTVFLLFLFLDSTKGQTDDENDFKEEVLIFRTSPAKTAYAEGVFGFRSVPLAQYWLLR